MVKLKIPIVTIFLRLRKAPFREWYVLKSINFSKDAIQAPMYNQDKDKFWRKIINEVSKGEFTEVFKTEKNS
ncbi:hypothetical protein Lwal_2049 [Legionella waltersii]|uniref:Uncharacterized protein n=1 Tax=Legionella waltersii TaxID=66969 RepID=A0A0W1A4N5_9GAMM|nr:hypothetical protein Lwal_2049 [Legionella waltersii]SNV13747.1 Uncharacterised protein [Legionella waltersii]